MTDKDQLKALNHQRILHAAERAVRAWRTWRETHHLDKPSQERFLERMADLEAAFDQKGDLRPLVDTLTIGQVGRITRFSVRTASKWVDNGTLKGYCVGQHRRVLVSELRKFMTQHGMPVEWLDEFLQLAEKQVDRKASAG